MIAPDFRRGEKLLAEDLQKLVQMAREIRAGQVAPAPGIRVSQEVDGTAVAVKARAVVGVDHAFRFTVNEDGEDVLLQFTTEGFVNGIEPKIGTSNAFEAGKDGVWPSLRIPPAGFDAARQRCLIYLRYTLDAALDVTEVRVEAHSKKPASSPTVFWKLMAVLQRDANGSLRVSRQMFFSQGFGGDLGGGRFPWAEA